MRPYRRCRVSVAAVLLAILAGGSEASAALASKVTGVKRFTARLSSNRAIRKQQLIVDPEGILSGSVSTAYDPTVVRFVGIADPGDFEITGGWVGSPSSPGGVGPVLLALDDYLSSVGATPPPAVGIAGSDGVAPPSETGYVQIFFERRDAGRAERANGPSTIPNLPGYETVAQDGPTGVGDTHALIFEYLPAAGAGAAAGYTVFATPPRNGTVPDSIIPGDDPDNPIPYTDLQPARVRASLESPPIDRPPAVPLPPAVWAGLVTLGAIAGLRLVRRW